MKGTTPQSSNSLGVLHGEAPRLYKNNRLLLIWGDPKIKSTTEGPSSCFEMRRIPVDTEEDAKARFDEFVYRAFSTDAFDKE